MMDRGWAAGEIAADDEFAVVGLFHAAVFPDDHAGDGVAALNVGDVEAFDAARFFEKVERVLDGFADHFGGGLEDAETLFERVLGVVRNEIEEGALAAALRREDFDFVAGAVGEGFFEQVRGLRNRSGRGSLSADRRRRDKAASRARGRIRWRRIRRDLPRKIRGDRRRGRRAGGRDWRRRAELRRNKARTSVSSPWAAAMRWRSSMSSSVRRRSR